MGNNFKLFSGIWKETVLYPWFWMEMLDFASIMETSYESDFIYWTMEDDEIYHCSFMLQKKNTSYPSNLQCCKVDPKDNGMK